MCAFSSVQGQHCRVQVEQDAAQRPRPLTQAGEQAIVQTTQLGQASDREASEEPAQRRGIGIGRQPGECLKHPVVAKQLGRLDPPQPKDDRVQQGEQHLGDAIRVVTLSEPHLRVEALTQVQMVKETVEEKDATIPRQMIASEGHANTSGATPMPHTALQKGGKFRCPITYFLVNLSGNDQIPVGRAAPRLWA
jgi:hypothetical protein